MTRRADPQTTRLPVPTGEVPTFTPVPRQCERHDGWTPERQLAFIEALADTGSVKAAAKVVDMSAEGAYYLRRQKGAETFRIAWQAALDLGVQRIEDVAMDRALNGVDEPLYSYGKLVGSRKRYNDRLLMFMLRNRSPERFAEGKAKGLNAIGKMEEERLRKRLKRELRAEWEAEQRRITPEEIRASIDAKIEGARRSADLRRKHEWEKLSEETREAWARFEELRNRDLDALNADEAMRRRMYEGPRETVNAEPPSKRVVEVEVPKTVHKLTDDGWD